MKVRELIEELANYDLDADVRLIFWNGINGAPAAMVEESKGDTDIPFLREGDVLILDQASANLREKPRYRIAS